MGSKPVDPVSFDNLRAQREIEDKAASDKPVLPTGLTLEKDLRVSKTFKNVVICGVRHPTPPDDAADPPLSTT